ncbi:TetR family transcriptional regulator [Paenibacillus sp. HN-1]|uniref:TetR/AcrR family transcriptional regulator n=1 Tax=Paenibacillus TaxID=44249 RepID=UPI001CA904AC|nr:MULTISPECIES: TetR/AcrR family transcriptional regulator [Paenibacillus]MBY9078390.1 TetR family transcriptional regulator [Paenibacillus sp. CGMCC 1.18879]MBY9087895.1 TetR family transcriptional regulator [Paenibacillus sinensis]
MTKRSYDSEQVRHDVLREAEALFSRKGYIATSISDISKAAGHSKGHIYYHFKSKEELFVVLAQQTIRSWGERWEERAAACGSAVEKVYAIADFVMDNYQQDLLKAGQELAALPDVQPSTLQALYGLAATPVAAYRSIIAEGMDAGLFGKGDPDRLSMLLGAWLGGLNVFVHTLDREILRSLYRETAKMFVKAVAAPGYDDDQALDAGPKA